MILSLDYLTVSNGQGFTLYNIFSHNSHVDCKGEGEISLSRRKEYLGTQSQTIQFNIYETLESLQP